MKKRIVSSLLLLLFLPPSLYAQQQKRPANAAEADALMKNIQGKLDSMMKDPKVKEMMKKNQQGIPPVTTKPQNLPAAGGGKDDVKLPPMDSARVRTIPRKNFTLPELSSYITDLRSQLSKKLPPGAVASANAIARKLNYDAGKLDAAAMQAWQKGATEEAVLLTTDAGARAANDGLLLTNTGAILDMSGLSEKAIPVLRTVVQHDPRNAIALNNLGQAYTQLGMHDSGMIYLTRCLSISPKHPEANNTAGQIELKRGNKAKAKTYFENSIHGSYTLRAYKGLRMADPEAKIRKLIKPKVKVPEYFNQFKYKLPPQCRSVQEAKQLEKEHIEHREYLRKVHDRYVLLKKDAERTFNTEGIKKMQQRAMNPGGNIVRPFLGLGATMLSETIIEFSEAVMELEKFNKENRRQYQELEKEFNTTYHKLPGKTECGAINAFINRYLEKFAQLNEEWQTRNLDMHKAYLDELLYWSYLGSMDMTEFRAKFFIWVENYLAVLNRLCQTKIIQGCNPPEAKETEPPVESELKEFECPVELEIPFIVGKLSLDCEKFSFSAGELAVFKYEKKFTGQRQSTMSLGIGANLYLLKVPGTSAASQIGANMSVFLSFDNMGHLTDGGVQYGAFANAGIEFEAGERIKLKKEMKKETGVGWRFGVSSGVNFDEGPLKGILNP